MSVTNKMLWMALAAMLCLSVSLQAAETFGFYNITNNSSVDVADQLLVEVSDLGGQVLFNFTNTGPLDSSITRIYFDDRAGVLSMIVAIDDSLPGVSFSEGASPSILPGGNELDPKFVVTASLLAGSDQPVAPNGVQPGEWVGITLSLNESMTYDSLLASLNDSSLRIGLRVQGIEGAGDEDSDGFVNKTPPVVPAPGAILLAGIGTTLVGWLRRRQHV